MQLRVFLSATLTASKLVARSLYINQGRILQNIQTKSPKVLTTYSISNQLRYFSNMSDNKVVTYDDVVTYKDKPEVYLVDVREPNELQETGSIPASINIPLGSVSDVLSRDADFKKKYNKDFPDKSKELVFYCKMGGRATKAMEQAIQLGFTNSKVYKGSWQDWASHQ